MQFHKISILLHGRFFVLHCSPPPLGNSSLVSYFVSKVLKFKIPPPPLGISDDLAWGGYGFFSGTAQSEKIHTHPLEGHWKFLVGGGGVLKAKNV